MFGNQLTITIFLQLKFAKAAAVNCSVVKVAQLRPAFRSVPIWVGLHGQLNNKNVRRARCITEINDGSRCPVDGGPLTACRYADRGLFIAWAWTS